MIRLTQNDWRIFRRLQRKHKVSTEFLRYNLENIEKFIWFETWPRIVIRRYAIRKGNRVFIIYYRLRRVLFDQSNSKIFKRMRQNIKQWSKRVVAWQKNHLGITEYVEEVIYDDKSKEKQETGNKEIACSSNEDVSKQLKEQLELLKNGRRPQSLITKENQKDIIPNPRHKDRSRSLGSASHKEKEKSDSNSMDDVNKTINEFPTNAKVRRDRAGTLDIIPRELSETEKELVECSTSQTQRDWQINLESTPEKQITTQANMQPVKQLDTDEKTEKSLSESSTQQTEKLKTGLNFLDMLMCKVSGSKISNTNTSPAKAQQNIELVSSSSSSKEVAHEHHHEHSMDSTDEFLGFDDCERIPGMLMTPIVPHSVKKSKNSVFISESLNEYMRLNDLETNYSIDEDKSVTKGKIFARDMEGLMTPKTKPPYFDMPAVPENLLKFRTVAERKQYLQKFSKNCRLAIINNEASIYRELQRRIRTQKIKSASQMLTQSANSSMSFTRNGWNAASFINTEFNKYYYQILDVDHGTHKIRLRGARGNNDEFNKTPYVSRVIKPSKECPDYCADNKVWEYLKPIKTVAEKSKKLNKGSMSSVFKPCPLSHKTFQKPLDDDTAALLLAGGSMAVVRMPTVELEVFPEYGKPLHEIAKRYLQYILPHHDISREWAEFSVSALQQPKTLKEAEQVAAKNFNAGDLRKSYTFVIPYLNDRNHILVRRVVDRSEKLDESFEQCAEEKDLVPKTDFLFRKDLDLKNDVLLTCADVVSDMINTVAISCSENSFIKTDPDGLNNDAAQTSKLIDISKQEGLERPVSFSPNAMVLSGGVAKKQKKQNSLLLELKRLNATIIDAAVKPKNGKKSCSKEYCQMGCICVSLGEVVPMRDHCGKTKCMLECSCKSSNQSRIMRLETDGRTLTTEDAFMLRRKATARLARMEKEFTSTVVLTENETLLINETNNDKKRRCTKLPKRYEDFTDTEDEQRRNSPKKTALTTIDKEKHLATEFKELYDPVYVEESILDKLKHCTVNLVPLKEMDNIAPWCMVHNLYKCFCKGRAVEGKPMVIEKEEVNTTFEHNADEKVEFDCNANAKAKYTFDKVEKKKSVMNNDKLDENELCNYNAGDDFDEEEHDDKDDDHDWIKERKYRSKESREVRAEKMANHAKRDEDSDAAAEDFSNTTNSIEAHKQKRGLVDVRKRFYMPRSESCRRHIPTPRRMFLYCNRRRRLNVLKFIKDNENDQTRLLLNEHVMRSVYYHKTDIENNMLKNSTSVLNEKHNSTEKSNCKESQTHKLGKNLSSAYITKRKFLLVNEVVDLLEDDDSTESNKNTEVNRQQVPSLNVKSNTFEKVLPDADVNHFQICSNGGVISVKKCTTPADLKKSETGNTIPSVMGTTAPEEPRALVSETDSAVVDLKLPKIASCFSLNAKASIQKPTSTVAAPEDQCLDFTCATSVHSAAFSQNKNDLNKNYSNPLPVETTAASKDTSSAHILDMNNENVRDVYNNVIKTMNTLVSKKMQDIDCALQRESHIIPTPNSDILCIMKWCNFLDAFCEGFAYIWQVKIKDASFFVVTIQNVMPLIIGAMGIVNITALKAEKMPLLGKMLLLKFRNIETEKLAVVMQGKQSHWVVKGFLKADPNIACNKPTPESHPSLTKKINVLCSLLVKQRQKEQKKKEKLASQWSSTQVNSAAQTIATPLSTPPQPPQHTPKIAQIMPTRRIVTIQPRPVPHVQNLNSEIPPQPPALEQLTAEICQQKDTAAIQKPTKNEADSSQVVAKINSRKRKIDNANTNSILKMDSYSKMSSNIDFRKVTQSDIDEIFLPELHKLDHKWLVLDLHNDFSHIFVPDFRDLVSLDRIQKVINFARQKSKIVKLQFFQNAPFDAFVTPKSIRKIYFGPLTLNMNAPTLILLQSVDGQMMLRELYQLQHNIVKKAEEKTKAFWLVHLKGQTHFEMDVGGITEKPTVENAFTNNGLTTTNKTIIETSVPRLAPRPASPANLAIQVEKNIHNDDDDDDEDCVIVEESSTNSNIKKPVQILPNANQLPTPLSSQTPKITNVESAAANVRAQSLLKVPNTSTIIKPLNTAPPVILNGATMAATNKPLPILTLPPNTVITGINPPRPMTSIASTQIVALPQTAVVTGIESAPPEAPYSSTIFIASSSPEKSVVKTTTTMSNVNISNKTITSSSCLENSRKQTNEDRSSGVKQSQSIIRQALEAGAIKRRRISLFCPNKYDKVTENIAVDAVLKKILPENAEDIQINPLHNKSNASSIAAPEVATTVSSMQVSQPTSAPAELNQLQTSLESSKVTEPTTDTAKSKAPIVFDVNFMDDGDEPTASIVIKPTSSTATSSTTTSSSGSKSFVLKTTTTITPITSTSVFVSANSTSLINSANLSAPPNKKIKLPTLFNTTTTAATKTKVINSFLCTKQANFVPKLSAPIPVTSKVVTTSCSSRSSLISPANTATSTPFIFRSPSSLKVQKVVSSSNVTNTVQSVKSIPITATAATNQPSTLTVKQVQDMLNKPGLNVATINSKTSHPPANQPPPPSLHLLPSIKATIAPAKAPVKPPAVLASSTIITSSASSPLVSSGCGVSPTHTANKPTTTSIPSETKTSGNSTLTISKVQSFGSLQKPNNADKIQKTFVSPTAQIVITDLDDKAPIPAPPSHIQYGYIVSAVHVNQKFVAKRVAEEFYVKVPSVGILKLQGLPAVNNYLNKFMNRILKETQTTPAVWQFVAASKAVQMQNHQKSLLVRQTKSPGSNSEKPGMKSNYSNNSLEEPILIDD